MTTPFELRRFDELIDHGFDTATAAAVVDAGYVLRPGRFRADATGAIQPAPPRPLTAAGGAQ